MNSSIVPIFDTNQIRINRRLFSNQTQQLIAENFQLLRSNIHGIGLFSLDEYPNGTEMNAAFNISQLSYLVENNLEYRNANTADAPLCAIRYMNHSETANIGFYKLEKNLIVARCLKNINFGDEITTDYRYAFALLDKPIPAWVNADQILDLAFDSASNPASDPEYEHALTGISIE